MNNAKYPSFVPDDCQSDFVDDDSYFVNYAEGHEDLIEDSRVTEKSNPWSKFFDEAWSTDPAIWELSSSFSAPDPTAPHSPAHSPISALSNAEEPASGQVNGKVSVIAPPKTYTPAAVHAGFEDEQVAYLRMLSHRYRRAGGDTNMVALTHHYNEKYHNATRTKGSLRTKLYRLDLAADGAAPEDDGN